MKKSSQDPSLGFQEGLHHNFTDSCGNHVRELHAHRLVVNHAVEAKGRRNCVRPVQQLWPAWGIGRDKLVKRVITDREGTRRSSTIQRTRSAMQPSRIREVGEDTWPHFLVNQRFLQPVSLADFNRMDFSVSYRVDRMNKLSNWPNHIRPARSGMNLNYMFSFATNPTSPKAIVGMMLYTSREKSWTPHLGIEQHGQVFYRESVAPDGLNILVPGETRTVNRRSNPCLPKPPSGPGKTAHCRPTRTITPLQLQHRF